MSKKAFISHTGEIAKYPQKPRDSFLKAAIAGVRAAGWEPDEMGNWTPTSLRSANECARRVKECDAYIGILGLLWGSEVPGESGVSFTKFEFESARHLRRPFRFFLIDEKALGFPADLTSDAPREDLEKQRAFRREVNQYVIRRVNTPEDLRLWVRKTLETLNRSPSSKAGVSQEEIDREIATYLRIVGPGMYDAAFRHFQKKLNYQLDFILSDHYQHLALLRKLFPDGVDGVNEDPLLSKDADKAAALNALARAYKNTGDPGKAVEIFRRQLELQRLGGVPRVIALANLTNALRLTGCLCDAEMEAGRMLEAASKLNQTDWRAYSLYWNGILRAGRGEVDQGVLLLRQAQVLFEDIDEINEQKAAAGIGRACAHLAQIELWLDNAEGARSFARRAHRLAEQHRERRESIFSARLLGTAELLLNRLEDSRRTLEDVVNDASACGYFEEQLAAIIGLAELDRREAKRKRALNRLDDELLDEAEKRGPFAMLLADSFNALCRIHRDDRKLSEAVKAAKAAFKWASMDRPPFQYYWGLEEASRHLRELGSPVAEIPTPAAKARRSFPVKLMELDKTERKKAELRAEFTKLLRTINGQYRYAPTKFIRMLREDWDAVRDIVSGNKVQVSPQFVEVHVAHPCNLSCNYCRGELRPVPSKQVFLPTKTILALIEGVYKLNRNAFIRFSGLIGEPLLHPEIDNVFEEIKSMEELKWGLTTNGIRLDDERLRRLLLGASYVHISVDAGTDKTYQRLKGGPTGTLHKVLENIQLLAKERGSPTSRPEIIASFILQESNYEELAGLAQAAKEAGADCLEIKMQHYDWHRRMSPDSVQSAYKAVHQLRRDLADTSFHIVIVQSRDEALVKIQDRAKRITFAKCYAGLLGLTATVDPDGNLQSCCQYYQDTLGSVGNIQSDGLKSVWFGKPRHDKLSLNPKRHCQECSPSDKFVNLFVDFLRKGNDSDSSFLDWVEKEALVQERFLEA